MISLLDILKLQKLERNITGAKILLYQIYAKIDSKKLNV